jgi:hypothetical protein
MWRITIEVLEELGDTGIDFGERNLTYLEIYGPEGRMGYFSRTWPTADAMLSELLQNHGGGVPAKVIEKLVLASEVSE